MYFILSKNYLSLTPDIPWKRNKNKNKQKNKEERESKDTINAHLVMHKAGDATVEVDGSRGSECDGQCDAWVCFHHTWHLLETEHAFLAVNHKLKQWESN